MTKMKIRVSFIVIALNASATIDRLFECLKKQTYPHDLIEVILVDSASDDDTKAKMIAFMKESQSFSRVIVLDNFKKSLPSGWNIALEEVKGDAVLRVDAHVTFYPNFVELNVRTLQQGEDICGGKVVSIPASNSPWSKTLNEAENSMFGGGIAAFRRSDRERYVDTVAFAIYRKAVFEKVGKYNESLIRTEDNEMHYRMRQAGYKFLYNPKIISYRVTRATFKGLLKQKYLNGYWIGKTLKIEPRCFSLYHFVPMAFVLSIVISLLLLIARIALPAKVLWAAYSVVNLLMTMMIVISRKDRHITYLLLPVIFLLLHIGYGVGTIVGLMKLE